MPNKIVWFRNNLRVQDNEPLLQAANAARAEAALVIPIVVLGPFWFANTSCGFEKMGPFRRKFLLQCLTDLDDNLRRMGSRLYVFEGDTEDVLAKVMAKTNADCVYAQREYATYEKSITRRVQRRIQKTGGDLWLCGPNTLISEDALPFAVQDLPETFSQFRKEVESDFLVARPVDVEFDPDCSPVQASLPISEGARAIEDLSVFAKLDCTHDRRAALEFQGGENQAWKRLQFYIWDKDLLRSYKITRNGMLGGDYSSKLSPWLAHGCISPRQIYAEVQRYESERVANESTYWLTFELLWRDYFAFIVAKHGPKVFQVGGLRQQRLPWNREWDSFNRWREGQTGFPLIDANMRELASTGFMSNRGRQNVASFLTKNLGVDWRIGAEWFESMLIDYDPCSNYGNWNYAAGVGNDARGFRWFNTVKQSRDYDADGHYIRHWLPCLENIPNEFIHEPWKMSSQNQADAGCTLGVDYPFPIVDLFASATKNEELYNQATPDRSLPIKKRKRTVGKYKGRHS
ncbi:MAG: DASH family cryptochrome [Aureliella sp.]